MVLRAHAPPLWVMPHGDVRRVDDVTTCASLAPNFIKCLLGEPRRFLGTVETCEHVMLSPFAPCRSFEDTVPLLVDLRRSLTVTPDEHDFLELWDAYRGNPESLPTSDRWVQRLCLRYAGQAPKRLLTLARLAQTLSADHESGLHNSLGAFADASHFARVCRAFTGRPPTAWRHLSQTFY
jgi:hypothetical protein